MPPQPANRAAEIAAALQWDRDRWFWLLLIVLFLDIFMVLGDRVTLLLRYDRAGLAAGGWWRLLTAHLVHLDWHHLILNELGLALVWALFASDYDAADWTIVVACGALAITCGLWWLSPGILWYVGLSGLLHTVMAAGTVRHLAERTWDRWILLACFLVKLSLEQYAKHTGSSAPHVVVDSHLYGSLAGFAAGAALCWRTAIIRRRHRI